MTEAAYFGVSYSRRLPIYIVVDCSESMIGEPMDAVNQGLQYLCADLQHDPYAIETAWLSVITFARQARQAVPLTEVLRFTPPRLDVGPGTRLGAALDLLAERLGKEVRRNAPGQKGDWKPIVFLLTDGQPTDDWQAGLKRFRSATAKTVVNVIAVGCGEDVDTAVLQAITPNVLLMKTVTAGGFRAFFKWVSASVSTASVGAGHEGQGIQLPAPPEGTFEAAVSRPSGGPPSQIILAARCRNKKQGYLMRYRRATPTGDTYQAEKSYPVNNDYFTEAAAGPSGQAIDASKLQGAPPCPHCGNPGWAIAPDKSGLLCSERLSLGGGRAQVMFVLDVTGSMFGEIEGVKNNIKDFMDYIKKEGLAVKVGLIAFRDLEEREPPEILRFAGAPFTTNAEAFKGQVSRLQPDGGGANPGESSYDALVLACRQPFDEDATRILVLITDEPPLLPDGEVRSVEDVIRAMKRAQIDQLYVVASDYLEGIYAPLHRDVKGQFFVLGAGGRGGKSFRDILLNIGQAITVQTRLG